MVRVACAMLTPANGLTSIFVQIARVFVAHKWLLLDQGRFTHCSPRSLNWHALGLNVPLPLALNSVHLRSSCASSFAIPSALM